MKAKKSESVSTENFISYIIFTLEMRELQYENNSFSDEK